MLMKCMPQEPRHTAFVTLGECDDEKAVVRKDELIADGGGRGLDVKKPRHFSGVTSLLQFYLNAESARSLWMPVLPGLAFSSFDHH